MENTKHAPPTNQNNINNDAGGPQLSKKSSTSTENGRHEPTLLDNKDADIESPEAKEGATILFKSLCRAFGPELMTGWAMHFLRVFATYLSPFVMR